MSTIRTQLPNATALSERVRTVLRSDLPNYLETTYTKRAELRSTGRFLIALAIFSVAVVVALYLTWDQYDTLAGRLVTGMTLLWITTFIMTGRLWFSNERLLTREMNMALSPILTNTLDCMLLYTHNEENEAEARVILERARLFDLTDTRVRSAGMYQVYGGPGVSVRELRIDQATNRLERLAALPPLFSGVLVEIPLAMPHPAETYCLLPSTRSTVAAEEYWRARTSHEGIHELPVPAEVPKSPLRIASSDAAAAETIFTTAFCEELVAWWHDTKGPIRGSVHGTKVYLLVGNVDIQADASVSTKPAVVERLTMRLARPLWWTLRLSELVTKD